jgi:hypothetical protein
VPELIFRRDHRRIARESASPFRETGPLGIDDAKTGIEHEPVGQPNEMNLMTQRWRTAMLHSL